NNPSGESQPDPSDGGGNGNGGRRGRGGRGGGGMGGGGFMHHYYYMYGLERAGILGLIPKFGEHDWYDKGCHMFVDGQKGDGSWDAGGDRPRRRAGAAAAPGARGWRQAQGPAQGRAQGRKGRGQGRRQRRRRLTSLTWHLALGTCRVGEESGK